MHAERICRTGKEREDRMLTFLMIGAHPDDMDLCCGGLAVRLQASGHRVIFLSMTNGNAGHMTMQPEELRACRLAEMTAAAEAFGGIRYETMDINDGYLTADIATRDRLIRYIRKEKPDVIITHRSCDYHPDHRACGQLVMDCSYLVGVPLICPEAEALRHPPVILLCEDSFTCPAPFRADIGVPLDAVIDQKIQGVLCHRSQFFEWLAYDGHWDDVLNARTEEEAAGHLKRRLSARFSKPVQRFPSAFPEGTSYGEVFQIDEYGGPMTDTIRAAMTGK